jgi:hypothetical protein
LTVDSVAQPIPTGLCRAMCTCRFARTHAHGYPDPTRCLCNMMP